MIPATRSRNQVGHSRWTLPGQLRRQVRFKMIDIGGSHIHVPGLVCSEVKPRDRTNHFVLFMTDGESVVKNRQFCGEPNHRKAADETNSCQEMKVTQTSATKAMPSTVILSHAGSVLCMNTRFSDYLIHRAHRF
jgi:hypothetical protein